MPRCIHAAMDWALQQARAKQVVVVVAHASSEGALAVLLKQWRMDGRQVTVLSN